MQSRHACGTALSSGDTTRSARPTSGLRPCSRRPAGKHACRASLHASNWPTRSSAPHGPVGPRRALIMGSGLGASLNPPEFPQAATRLDHGQRVGRLARAYGLADADVGQAGERADVARLRLLHRHAAEVVVHEQLGHAPRPRLVVACAAPRRVSARAPTARQAPARSPSDGGLVRAQATHCLRKSVFTCCTDPVTVP